MLKRILIASICLFSCDLASAISINRAQIAPRRGVVIATVDLEKIFAAYPATKRAKEELGRLILIKENEIASKRAEIFSLTNEIAKMKAASSNQAPPPPAPTPTPTPNIPEGTALPGMPSSTYTFVNPPVEAAPPPTPPATKGEIDQKEEQLKYKKEELRLLERAAEKNLEDLEQAKTKTILGQIFIGLRELASEKNVDMIVDRNSVLWGASNLDLTDALLKKLKHKVIETE